MKFNKHFGPGLSGRSPEWLVLGGPGAATKEQAFRFGQSGARKDFERWAMQYAGGKFFTVLDAEYTSGKADRRSKR